MVIEAEGIPFVAEKAHFPMISGLRLGVEQSFGRAVLIASHSVFAPYGSC